jgi:hypothetical protein
MSGTILSRLRVPRLLRAVLLAAGLALAVAVVPAGAVPARAAVGAAAALPSNCSQSGSTMTCTFNYNGPTEANPSAVGSAQSFTVPAGVQSINVTAIGARGDPGAAAGEAQSTFTVTPGQPVEVLVGGQGDPNGCGPSAFSCAGFNGGGLGGPAGLVSPILTGGTPGVAGGSGGGASDVRMGACASTPSCGLAARVLVGGGSGGLAYSTGGELTSATVAGGGGGDPDGGVGSPSPSVPDAGGGGGAQSDGGSAGVATQETCGNGPSPYFAGSGVLGGGGDGGGGAGQAADDAGAGNGGGGGGGGYWGGGGGMGQCPNPEPQSGPDTAFVGAGGGGSSYGPSGTTYSLASSGGNGQVIISYAIPPLSVTTSNVVNGVMDLPVDVDGSAYSVTLGATGGIGPYTWSVTSGSLPVGLTLNPATGVISGTTPEAGEYVLNPFTVQVTDAESPAVTASQQVMLESEPAPPSITTTSLPAGTVGSPYQATLAMAGGVGPYLWSVTSGSLPPGLALPAFPGVISGTPTQAGTFSFAVQVSGEGAPSVSQVLSITVNAPTTTTVSSAAVAGAGQPVTYTATISPAPGGGTVGFTDNGTPIPGCTAVPVSGSTATCQATPTAGANNIAATFTGSSGLAGSTSATTTQVATPASCTSLAGCDLSGLNLTGAQLAGADLSGANLNGATLSGADLAGADLAGANFNKADLAGADLNGATVTGTTNFNKVTWSDTTCPDGTNSNNDGGTCAGHL